MNRPGGREVESFLSQNVVDIVCRSIKADGDIPSSITGSAVCMNEYGVLNWDLLTTHLPELQETAEYYKHCVEILVPLFNCIQSYYHHLTCDEFKSAYDEHLSWISQKPVLFRCFELLKSDSPTAANHSLLLLTSVFERGLGDLVFIKVKRPPLLRDLLNLDELKELLSPVVVQMLRILLGPPISLNLRNLLWHGFPSPTEIHPLYSYTLLCIAVSIGNLLCEKRLMDQIPFCKQFFSVALPSVFPDLCSTRIDNVRKVFLESSSIPSRMRPFALLSLQLLSEERYGECVVVFLPQLEQVLRGIFVEANDCPERLMTAENNSLFTTFDEILNKYLNNGAENQFRKFVGDSYLMLLLDFLVYPLGPRVRDRISHAEVLLSDVPRVTAEHLVWLYYIIVVQNQTNTDQWLQNDFYDSIQRTVAEYESIFHPLSVVKQKISSMAQSLSKWSMVARPGLVSTSDGLNETDKSDEHHLVLPDENSLGSVQSSSDLPKERVTLKAAVAFEQFLCPERPAPSEQLADWYRILEPFNDCYSFVNKILEELHQNTIYRYQKLPTLTQVEEGSGCLGEQEILRILSKVISLTHNISEQLIDILQVRLEQWKKKELRSRQRITYARMLERIDLILDILHFILFTSLLSVCKLDDLTCQKSPIVIRFLKKVQKFCENLIVQTSINCNRWDEAVAQSLNLIKVTMSLTSNC